MQMFKPETSSNSLSIKTNPCSLMTKLLLLGRLGCPKGLLRPVHYGAKVFRTFNLQIACRPFIWLCAGDSVSPGISGQRSRIIEWPSATESNSPLNRQISALVMTLGLVYWLQSTPVQAEVYLTEVARWAGEGIANMSATDVVVRNGIAYVAGYSSGLHLLDVSTPSAPRFLATAGNNSSLTCSRLAIGGAYAFALDGWDQYLQVYDVTIPTNAARIAFEPIGGGSARHISLFAEPSRNRLYLGGYQGYLRVIDISQPWLPDQLDHPYNGTKPVNAIVVTNNIAYLANDANGLRRFDVSGEKPVPISNDKVDVATGTSLAMGVAVSYPYAYVACTSRGLRVVDLRIATEVLPGATTSGPAMDVKLDGNLAYVACDTGGLDVFDISNPAAPVRVGQFPGVVGASMVFVGGSYAYVACGTRGLAILAVDFVSAGLGRTVVAAGTSGSVPVQVVSHATITNLTFQVCYPPDRLNSFSLTLNSPQILNHRLSTTMPGILEVTLTLSKNQVLGVQTNLGTLNFMALAGQTSDFVDLEVSTALGIKPGGTLASSGPSTPGRVVIVGSEPLLEMVTRPDRSQWIVLYSLPGYRTQILSCTNLSAPYLWAPKYYDTISTSLQQSIGPIDINHQAELFSARHFNTP